MLDVYIEGGLCKLMDLRKRVEAKGGDGQCFCKNIVDGFYGVMKWVGPV